VARVEEDAAGVRADGLERVPERRRRYGVQVVVKRGDYRPGIGMRYVRRRRPGGKFRFPVPKGVRSDGVVLPWGHLDTFAKAKGVR
jgi:hypothetical protein